MSLQKCPECKKINSFWHIYWKLNKKHFQEGMFIRCQQCGEKMHMRVLKRSFFQRVWEGFLWMMPAFVVIYLVARGELHFFIGILLMIAYHFIAFILIIHFLQYRKK